MNLNFAQYDFTDLLAQLNALMRRTVSWDAFKSGTGQMLMELYAYVGTLIGYYTERRAEESYLLTARNRSSLLNLAALVGYQPQLRTSAAATVPDTGTPPVVLSIATNPYSSNLVVPRGTRLRTADEVDFYVTTDTFIPPGVTSLSVGLDVIQGTRTVRDDIATTSAAGFSIVLSDANIENTPPKVSVGATPVTRVVWTWVPSFKGYGPEDTVYKTQVNSDDSVTIVFGDGVRGAIPTTLVSVEYTISDGLAGNVTSTGALTTVVDALYLASDTYQTTPITVTLTNTAELLGGADIETNDQIRDLAPAVFATGDRAVTAADCRTIVNNIGGVTDSVFWGEYDIEQDGGTVDYTKMNTVYYSAIADDWSAPSSAYQDAIEALLREKGMMSILYSYVAPTEIDVVFQIKLRATTQTNLTNLYAQVVALIQAEFVLGTTSLLGVSKYRSVMTQLVQSLLGVVYVHLDMYVRTTIPPGAATINITPPFTKPTAQTNNIVPGSVKLYLWDGAQTSLAAIDDGAGNLIWYASPYAGHVHYDTGVVSITSGTVAGTAGTSYVLVQQDNTLADLTGDLNLSRTQIARVLSASDIQFI